jgi:integrase
MFMARPLKPPPRTVQKAANFYWEPSGRLRSEGGFRTHPLGENVAAAFALARQLNKQADEWLAKAGPARPKKAAVAEARASLTFSELANRYRQSPNWAQLRATTRATYETCLKILEAEFGHERANLINRARVLGWADRLRIRSPQGLRHYAAVARTLYNWALDRELVAFSRNPFDRMGIEAGRRAVRIREADLLALVAIADRDDIRDPVSNQPLPARPDLGTCMLVAFFCIQRESDVLRLTAANFAAGGFRLVQSKTGKEITLTHAPAPVLARLEGRMPNSTLFRDAADMADPDDAASRAFARLKTRAAIADPALAKRIAPVQLRDMRRSGFVHYAEGARDATGKLIRPPVPVHLICSISGHTIEEGMAILEVYLPKTTEQADMAVSMMMGATA